MKTKRKTALKKKILYGKRFTITDINKAGFNLEPTFCRNCKNPAFLNFGMHSVMCEHCGLVDDGSSLKKQKREQGILK